MKFSIVFIALTASLSCTAQTLQEAVERNREDKIVRVVFYNVENLFDTIADANVADEEFLPGAVKNWNTSKYRTKVANIAKTIRAVGGWQAPEIVGLAEIENRSVLLSLTKHSALKQANYSILHYDSPDPRGIDVALLYNADRLQVLYSENIKVEMPNSRTRDILYAKLLTSTSDTLHVFVNHWSSRSGGQQESEYKRVAAANTLKTITDSIQNKTKKANIIVMGDFNDSPKNQSLAVLTGESQTHPLINLMGNLPISEGSHKYKGVWDYLDQILVSEALVTGKLVLLDNRAWVFKEDFLLEKDDRYGDVYPKRTWKGDAFVAGYSDHLPVFCDILLKK